MGRRSDNAKHHAENEWRHLQDEGVDLWRQRRFDESLAALEASLALKATIIKSWLFKSAALQGLGRYTEALLAINEAQRLDAPIVDSPWRVHTIIAKADILIAMGRALEAITLLEEATKQFPLHALLWSILGAALARADRNEQAITAYRHALTLVTNDKEGARTARDCWDGISFSYTHLKRYSEALVASEQAFTYETPSAESWSNKGSALLGLKRYAEAAAAFHQARVLQPTLAAAWYGELEATVRQAHFQDVWCILAERATTFKQTNKQATDQDTA